jgi:hypothetical protein
LLSCYAGGWSIWIPALPAALYGLWWALDGRKQATRVTLGHIEHLPRSVFDSLSAGAAAIREMEHGSRPGGLSSGHVLAVLALLLLILWLARGGRPSASALAVGSTLLAFWLLTGASAIPGRRPTSSRYQLTDSVLRIVADRRTAARHGPTASRALGAVALARRLESGRAAAWLRFLRVESGESRPGGARDRSPAGALRPVAAFTGGARSLLSGVTAGRYFALLRDRMELLSFAAPRKSHSAPSAQRHAADSVLATAYRIATPPAVWAAATGRCSRRRATGAEVPRRSPRVGIRNLTGAPLVVGVSRFRREGRQCMSGFWRAGPSRACKRHRIR